MTEGLHKFSSYWISAEFPVCSWRSEAYPAPYFRREFFCPDSFSDAFLYICGLGYCKVWLNGEAVSENILEPVVTQYDKRVHYLKYNLAGLLRKGQNVLAVVLGTGWYNNHSHIGWQFNCANWRDNPKLLCELFADDKCLLKSDLDWKVTTDGPIVYDSLRNGESYDARLEMPGWNDIGFDDSAWKNAVQVAPPPGILQQQEVEPIKVFQEYEPCASKKLPDGIVYDFPLNIAGWCKLQVKGEKGAKISLIYGELKSENGDLDIENISYNNYSKRQHLDTYILNGKGTESWEPSFTYHGFQFVKVQISGKAEIVSLKARFIHSDFKEIGHFKSSDATLNRLQELTKISYLSNYVGIPTDCPQREKNGWTGDALLAAETGLWNFQSAAGYRHFTRVLADTQRLSGQLPGIAPSAGWGYNWGSGPAWDSFLIQAPWYVYLYTGDDSSIKENYPEMLKYMEFCRNMARDNLLYFGLGDWCHHDRERIADIGITSSGYYHKNAIIMAKFAELLNYEEDKKYFLTLASDIRNSFRKKFYHGNGLYGLGEWTALACAVFQGLANKEEAEKACQRLVELVRLNKHKADFGILGAKYVPRVLSDAGYIEDAFLLITQPEFPGWGHWIQRGAASLWENWDGKESRNHIMFGDISAWMYEYLGGVRPTEEAVGFKKIIIKPQAVSALNFIEMTYESKYGLIKSSWQKKNRDFVLQVEIPENSNADLTMPNGEKYSLNTGKYELECQLPFSSD